MAAISVRVFVDGIPSGRVRFGRPCIVEGLSGLHEVLVRQGRLASQPVAVDLTQDEEVVLYGGIRPMPFGMSRQERMLWIRSNGLWLSHEPSHPRRSKSRPSKGGLVAGSLQSQQALFFSW